MKYGSLQSSDRWFRNRFTEDEIQLIHDARFRARRNFRLGQDIERQLAGKYFVLQLLEIKKIDSLLLQLIDSGIATFRGRFQKSNRAGLNGKGVMEVGK